MSKRSTTPRAVDPAHVAVRAYFAWLNAGATHGHDVADWLAAEAAQRRSDAARQGAEVRAIKRDLARMIPAGWSHVEGGGHVAH